MLGSPMTAHVNTQDQLRFPLPATSECSPPVANYSVHTNDYNDIRVVHCTSTKCFGLTNIHERLQEENTAVREIACVILTTHGYSFRGLNIQVHSKGCQYKRQMEIILSKYRLNISRCTVRNNAAYRNKFTKKIPFIK
jgi:hypothetical protein